MLPYIHNIYYGILMYIVFYIFPAAVVSSVTCSCDLLGEAGRFGWGHIRISYKAPKDYTKPQRTRESFKDLTKPRQTIQRHKILDEPQKDYTKIHNIRQMLKISNKSSNTC